MYEIIDATGLKLRETCSILEAIQTLESTGRKILIVESEQSDFKGVITDGDIRSAISRGKGLEQQLSDVYNDNPIVIRAGDVIEKILEHHSDIEFFPLLEGAEKCYRLVSKALPGKKLRDEVALVIMAGGKGTRLLPHTLDIPKPMVEVLGKPILEHLILHARSVNIQKIYISVGHLSENIMSYFKDGSDWDVDIDYLVEDEPLGTAGSLSLIPEETIYKDYILINGDIISNINLAEIWEFHAASNEIATMAVKQHVIQNPYGVVHLKNDNLLRFEEKPSYVSTVNCGVYCFSKSFLKFAVKEKVDMPTLLQKSIAEGCTVKVYNFFDTWADIGTPKDLIMINANDGDQTHG
jgi:dTDP-glucose pyrophosphorylase